MLLILHFAGRRAMLFVLLYDTLCRSVSYTAVLIVAALEE
jgi:hypothetical protein